MQEHVINLVPGKGEDSKLLEDTLKSFKGVERVEISPNKDSVKIIVIDNFDKHILEIMNEINNKTGFKAF